MKALKIILSVLILLLAVVSALFSYFLYEKRVQFVDGWQQLAKTIHTSSSQIDRSSGTKVAASELDPAKKISHEQYQRLAERLALFAKQVKELVEQRDYMAEALGKIAERLSVNGGTPAELKDVHTYRQQADAVNAAFADMIERRSTIYRELISIGRTYRFTLQEDQLNSGDLSSLAPLREYLNAQKKLNEVYGGRLEALSSRAGAPCKVTSSDTARQAFDNVFRELESSETIKREKREALDKVASRDREIESKNAQIADLKKQSETLTRELLILKRSVGLADDFVPWIPGSDEARAHASGEVTKVSGDYGYFTINLGSTSTVPQTNQNTSIAIPLMLKSGVQIYVVRDDDLIATVALDRVGDEESTADIPAGVTVKKGDTILFRYDSAK